jgi:myosin V
MEQTAVAREATLLAEHQEKDATSKALAEAQGRIEGLLKEIYSANRKNDQLQSTIERFVVFITRKSLMYPVFTPICKHLVECGGSLQLLSARVLS